MKLKREIGAIDALYPTPTVLVGTMVNGKPNFATIAHVGIMSIENLISISLSKTCHTNLCIRENATFSVNIPTEAQVKETDYCGIVSGKSVDKAALFKIFYGTLDTAPMIVECPISMECRLIKTIEFPKSDVFVGEIVQTYCDENALEHGGVDLAKVKPILFDMNSRSYWSLGEKLAPCWRIGRDLGK